MKVHRRSEQRLRQFRRGRQERAGDAAGGRAGGNEVHDGSPLSGGKLAANAGTRRGLGALPLNSREIGASRWPLVNESYAIRVSARLGALEISQIWERLVLPGRHQQPIRAEHVVFPADGDMIVLAAIFFGPSRPWIWIAPIALHHGPRLRQSVVDHRDFVMGHVGISLVDVNPLLDHGLIVRVQWKAAAVECAGTFDVFGVTTNSISPYPLVTRGMPGEMHV
jgi:hypothetical protein